VGVLACKRALACSRLGSKAEREKPQRRCHQRFANSSLTCTLSCQPCPGEKSLRFATSVTAGSPPITVSNTSPPPVPGPLCRPGDISTGTRFLTRQSANWQQYDYTRKDGQLLLSPSTYGYVDTWRSKSIPPAHSPRFIPCCLRRHIYSQRRGILCVYYCNTSSPNVIVGEDNLAGQTETSPRPAGPLPILMKSE
jgi:hypothetical protein